MAADDVRAAAPPAASDRNTDRGDVASDADTAERVAQRIRERIEDLNARATSVQFNIDREHDRVVVRVISRESGETIRQIPAEEILQMRDAFDNLRGVLISETH